MDKTNSGRSGPVTIVSGTRPEVIKLAPLHSSLKAILGADRVWWVDTGQHQDLGRATLNQFAITPDRTLEIRADGDDLCTLHARAVADVTALIDEIDPAMMIVQGDTLSALAAAFAAFHARVPLVHVEAGLRTGNTHNPYPEEAYRRMIDAMADLRFAPTAHAARNLLAENMRPETIWITGNTAIDALLSVGALSMSEALHRPAHGKRLILTTLHRRESWGQTLRNMCLALADIADAHPDVEIVLPLHVNPQVRETIRPILEGHPQIHLVEPLSFGACHDVMKRATLILTDSGGIQEEAPSYRVPTLVLRESTERPEAIESGQAVLVGTDRNRIVAEATRLLAAPDLCAAMTEGGNPFGDGKASDRIALAIRRYLEGQMTLLTAEEEFSAGREPERVPLEPLMPAEV